MGMLQDRLVLRFRCKGVQARLFRERECNLSKALEILRISEATEEQLRDITGEDKPSINAVHNEKHCEAKPTVTKQARCYEEQKRQMCKYCGGSMNRLEQNTQHMARSVWRCKKPNHYA